MPTYTFKDTKTKKVWEDMMSISEMEKFLEENPHVQQVPTQMNIGDAVRMGITKPPKWYAERHRQIQKSMKTDAMNRRYQPGITEI